MGTYADPFEFEIGDLCIYTGKREFTRMKQRVIYRVVDKQPTNQTDSMLSKCSYTFEVAYDPVPETDDSKTTDGYGHSLSTKELGDFHESMIKPKRNGARYIKKLELVELGKLRNSLDVFIRDWAINKGK